MDVKEDGMSTPFCIGLPVVDTLDVTSRNVVLRCNDADGLIGMIRHLQRLLSKNDMIKVYEIGYRPDKPIPRAKYFAEVHVSIGNAEEWMYPFGLFSGAWTYVVTGLT